jgi:phospholipase C
MAGKARTDRVSKTKDANMANQLAAIKHVVQLMLENRSFDQMLGFLYESNDNKSAAGQPFEGLTGDEFNVDDAGTEVKVFKITPGSKHPYFMPGADPGEGFHNTNIQLFSTGDPAPGSDPANDGFIKNFKTAIAYDLSKHFRDSLPGTRPSDIMGMYTPEMLPVLSALARGFAVCDHWFASLPTQTLPNRAFAAAATSLGFLANQSARFFPCPSIFGRLSAADVDWAIYGYDHEPMTRLDFPDTRSAADSHFGLFSDFRERAAAGTLPAYTFLEPNWGASGNSQHPNYDVALGEQLIHDVYYALHDGPGWNDTLLLITYDEHGGNYDHVPPPSGAVPPDDSVGEFGFDFTRFGVRVPALLVSPRVAAGTVFRAKRGTIDHTSVLKTLELRWDLDPLTARDKAAPDLGDALTLATPRTDDPLQGVQVPVSGDTHPNSSQPSELEMIHAAKVAALPMPDVHGGFDRHTPPDLSSSAAISDYIQMRTAAWKEYRQRVRRQQESSGKGPGKRIRKTTKRSRG